MEASRKQEDLQQLKRLTEQLEIVGWASNMWLNGLISRYPLHYLLLTQHQEGKEHRKSVAKTNIITKFQSRIETLMELTLQEGDAEQFEALIEKLDQLIAKRSKKSF
jgi:hypothetical protein